MGEIAIGIGVLLSLFFLEIFGVAAGGIVVAGYIAMFLHQPMTIVVTLVISVIIFLIIKGLSKIMFVYGKRRMVITVMLSFIFGWIVREYGILDTLPLDYAVTVIGYIIPGLIGNSMVKQGVTKTVTVMLVAAVCVRLIIVLVSGGQLIV